MKRIVIFAMTFMLGMSVASAPVMAASSKDKKATASSSKKTKKSAASKSTKTALKPMAERKKAAATLRKSTPYAASGGSGSGNGCGGQLYADKCATIMVDARTGTVLSSVNSDSVRYPASLTKMMTVYLAFEAVKQGRLSFTQKVPVSAYAASQPALDLGLVSGEYVSIGDLVTAIVVRSANDAAVALAEAVGGSEDSFAVQMTRKARALGMSQTTFKNASGLPDMQQVTSARDMARLGIALRRDFPEYYHYFAKRSMYWKGRTIQSHNRVTLNYPGADGLKTGYIRLSGFNLVTSARRGKNILVGVVMGGRSAHLRDEHMVNLLDRGFAMLESGASPSADMAEAAEPASSSQISYQPPAVRQATANDNGFVSPATSRNQGYHAKWAVQVGAFSNPKDAMMAATNAIQMASAYLQHSKIEIVSDASAQNIHRARLTQLSENQARSACSALIRQRESCFVLNLDS